MPVSARTFDCNVNIFCASSKWIDIKEIFLALYWCFGGKMGPFWPSGVPKWHLIEATSMISMGPTQIGHYMVSVAESCPFKQTEDLHRGPKGRFWWEMALFWPSRVPKWPKIGLTFMISVWHTRAGCLVVFLTFLEHLGTQTGFSPSGGQFFSSDRDPTWQHCGRVKCIIGHMRPALFLVHFYSKFMVLVLKRPKIREIARNLEKRGKKCRFWTYSLDKISKFDCLWLLWCVFLVFSLKYIGPPLKRIQNCLLKADLGCRNQNFGKRAIFRILYLLFWKNACFILFFLTMLV